MLQKRQSRLSTSMVPCQLVKQYLERGSPPFEIHVCIGLRSEVLYDFWLKMRMHW